MNIYSNWDPTKKKFQIVTDHHVPILSIFFVDCGGDTVTM